MDILSSICLPGDQFAPLNAEMYKFRCFLGDLIVLICEHQLCILLNLYKDIPKDGSYVSSSNNVISLFFKDTFRIQKTVSEF